MVVKIHNGKKSHKYMIQSTQLWQKMASVTVP